MVLRKRRYEQLQSNIDNQVDITCEGEHENIYEDMDGGERDDACEDEDEDEDYNGCGLYDEEDMLLSSFDMIKDAEELVAPEEYHQLVLEDEQSQTPTTVNSQKQSPSSQHQTSNKSNNKSKREEEETIHPFIYEKLTEEQQAVVDAVARQGSNAIVNAVAGSGKTRTALTAAIHFLQSNVNNDKSVLLVAYNKRLQEDMYAQCMKYPDKRLISRITIRTIHSLGRRYFESSCSDSGLTRDGNLVKWYMNKQAPVKPVPNFQLIIIDEAQDLTPLLYNFMYYFMSTLSIRPQLLILGDPFQLLYRFKGANECYILQADEKFKDVVVKRRFEFFKLSICFRITFEMAQWININLNPNNLNKCKQPYKGWFDQHKDFIKSWWGEGIKSNPNRQSIPNSIQYYIRPTKKNNLLTLYNQHERHYKSSLEFVIDEITKIFKDYGTSNCALLSPSIVANEKSPVRLVTNLLENVEGVKQSWYIDDNNKNDDLSMMNEDLRKNKRVATTIHKFKGCERDAVVLLGLDAWSENIEKLDPRNVFNCFYVGATRAKQKLLIIQWSHDAFGTHSSRKAEMKMDEVIKDFYEVTKLLDYTPYDPLLCEDSNQCLSTTPYYEDQDNDTIQFKPINLSRDDYIVMGSHNSSNTQKTVENISAIIGTAIEIKLQLLLDDGKLKVLGPYGMFDTLVASSDRKPRPLLDFLKLIKKESLTRISTYQWHEVLQIATALLTLKDGFYSRWRQVSGFDTWAIATRSAHKLDAIVKNLIQLIHHPFCQRYEPDFETQLNDLKALRQKGQILFNEYHLRFNMASNEQFVKQCAPDIMGIPDITFISENAALKLGLVDNFLGKPEQLLSIIDVEDIITIVEVKTTTTISHDHILQVGCYGSMWREEKITQLLSSKTEELPQGDGDEIELVATLSAEKEKQICDKVKLPNMLVVYPNLAELLSVTLHMDSLDFMHRTAFRKINLPFDEKVLIRERRMKSKPNTEKGGSFSLSQEEMVDMFATAYDDLYGGRDVEDVPNSSQETLQDVEVQFVGCV